MKLFTLLKHQHSISLFAASLLLSSAAAGAASYPETVLADNPVAYYRFEDPTNTVTIVDSSASGAYGGIINFDDYAAWPRLGQPGVGSNSVSFHLYTDAGGASQKSYVSVPYTADLNQTGPFTVECWARATSFGGTDDWRSPVGNFGGWGDASGWFFYQSPGSGSSWIWVQKGGGIWVGQVPVRKNQWDYLAAVFDGTTVTFYINGVARGSANASTATPNSGRDFCIGQRADNYGYFDGNVDEVAIYTNALSVDRIQLHYQVGLTNFYSGPIAAYITTDPASVTAFSGHPVQFVVGADGTLPLAYQWYKNNTLLAGQTTDTLTFVCSYDDNDAIYKVVVTNAYGTATSANATLTVQRDLTLVSSPASITRNVGSKAAFLVVPGGARPVTYQWFKGSTAIPGETNQMLWLSNLQPGDDATSYYARVRNAWYETNSEVAALTVVARANTVPITGYAKVVMADDPVAFWRLNEPDASGTAVDAAGSFDGQYDAAGAGSFGPGVITYGAGTGVPLETDPGIIVTNGARVKIPYALELNPLGPFTAEAWVKPSSTAWDPLDYRTIFSSMGAGPTGWLLYQQPNNTFAWVVFNDNWISSFIGDPIDTITAETWYHIALAYDGSLFHIYVNGRRAVSQRYDIFNPARSSGMTHLGWRNDNDWRPFAGTIDEVAFYNKALTLDQVQAHHQATVKLSITRLGNNIVLSWPLGTLQQSDQVTSGFADLGTATSPWTNTIGATPKFYRVKVQ